MLVIDKWFEIKFLLVFQLFMMQITGPMFKDANPEDTHTNSSLITAYMLKK